MADIATAGGPGNMAAMFDLLDGLLARHADDSVSVAALLALREYHLPELADTLA